MKRRVALLPLVLILGLVLAGCDQPAPVAGGKISSGPPAPPPPPPPPGSEAVTPAAPPAPAAAPTQPPVPIETKVGVFAGGLDDLAAPANAPQPQPATPPASPPVNSDTEIVKAGKGVGAKGRSLDQYEGAVVTPVKAYFAARERLFFEAEFPKNYQLWEASGNDTPKDFDDLKTKFLDPLGLTRKLSADCDGAYLPYDFSLDCEFRPCRIPCQGSINPRKARSTVWRHRDIVGAEPL